MRSAPPEAGQWQRIAPYLDQALDLELEQRERWLTDLTVTEPVEGKDILTLQTCTLPDYSQRLIVQAEKVT